MLQWSKNIYLHPKQVLPCPWDYLGNSLHYRHWYVVFWLHSHWISDRLPYFPWWKWAWAACIDHVSVGPALWELTRAELAKRKLFLVRFKWTNLRCRRFLGQCPDSRFKTAGRYYRNTKWFIFWFHSAVPNVGSRRTNNAFLSVTAQMDNWRLTSKSSRAPSTHAWTRCSFIS